MIIGFAGLAGSGKDTAAQLLGLPIHKFASGIVEDLLDINPLVDCKMRFVDAVWEAGLEEAKRQIPEVRRVMQEYGMKLRETDEYHWIKRLHDNIDLAVDGAITDVRFTNELHYVQDLDGPVIWVERPGIAKLDHISERSIDSKECDYIVVNDGSLDDLKANLQDIISSWTSRP